MSDGPLGKRRTWAKKFKDALRGLVVAVRGHSSFVIHLSCAAVVLAAAAALRVSLVQWCLLLLCIATVLAAEVFNTALESLAKAIQRTPSPHIADGLDLASAAVLVLALGAAAVGVLVFLSRLAELLG